MSNINYDFYIHSLMLLYKERVEQRIQKKDRGLTQEFWDDVLEFVGLFKPPIPA
ncbi:uncharacterized protein ARMOST_19806 [Armillaria ostoyae]|uniref:Uncharacterized protein n=1 Tax=Armillaria ostoyae TaxID=47428 RepID=A0A284S5Q2_ARMOS|nr:uncharacterized protein ARMOST_19806 [Armillaria ostoyae]